jgi:hypothetical protein
MKEDFLKSLPVTTAHQRIAVDGCVAIITVGSTLYGTNTSSSDLDYEGIFIEPPEYVIGTKSCDEVDFSTKSASKFSAKNTPKDIDIKLYSLKNFFYLAQKANPNKIEYFFIPERNIVYKNPKYWDQIVAAKDMCLSLKIKHAFSGYAMSQKKKLLLKKKRLEELREFKEILEQGLVKSSNCNPTIADIFKDIPLDNYKYITPTVTSEGTPAINVDEKIYNYGMQASDIFQRISLEISRYGSRTLSLDEGGYDYKFASHLFRLYYEGLRLLKEGSLTFPLDENKFLISVKNGEYDLDYLLKRADEFEPLFETAYLESKLPHSPDQDGISRLQTSMYLEYWQEKGWI